MSATLKVITIKQIIKLTTQIAVLQTLF